MVNKFITTLVLIVCFGSLRAQDMLGTWGSNYAGVSSTFQNPAFIANSKLYADINLIGVNFSYYHNDSYLEDIDAYVYEMLHKTIGFPKQLAKTNYYRNHRPELVNAYISARELGPAFMLNNGRNAFAVSFSTREFVSLKHVPDVVAKLTKYGSADASIIQHGGYDLNQPIRGAGLAWGEIDFTYARVMKSDDQDVITLGATLKYLVGIGGGFGSVDKINFSMQGPNAIVINNSDAKGGFSMPYDYTKSQDQLSANRSYKFGKGFGTDLGFSVQHNSRMHNIQRFSRYCEQEFEQYDYRFAVSLLDLGYIKFKDNALSGTLKNNLPINYNLNNFVFTSTQAAIDTVNNLYNKSTPSITSNQFSILLPSAISFQYDKRITDNIYVTAGGVIGIPLGKNALQRPSQLAIIPRYESDIFEVSIPLSLYDMAKPRLGLSTRIFFLTLGTDRLISLNGVHDYYGYDFYASIRLNFMKFFRMQYVKGECHESSTHPCY